jgi:hypothetical protein
MAKVDWAILCERAIAEAQANTVSLVCILENITLAGVPPADLKNVGVPFRFYVVQQWVRTKSQISEMVEGRVVLKSPDGKQLGHMDYQVDLRKTPAARVISQIPAFPYAGVGVYKVQVQIKQGSTWRTLRETQFNLIAGPGVANVAPIAPAPRRRLNS